VPPRIGGSEDNAGASHAVMALMAPGGPKLVEGHPAARKAASWLRRRSEIGWRCMRYTALASIIFEEDILLMMIFDGDDYLL
jgi:hypothetical protein